jgi:Ca2+-binding RTX toxin-like protein
VDQCAPPKKRRRFVVRRTMMLVAAMGLALVLAAGVALAQPYGDQGPGVNKPCASACNGTTYPDTLIGSDAPNLIHGLGGNESPTSGDYIAGHGGDDTLYGEAGGDKIEGGNGADRIYGGPGQNLLIGGTGLDRIYGGSGSETIMVRDGYRDVVNCGGPGDDISNRDPIDVFSNC